MDKTLSKPWTDFIEKIGLSDPFRVRNPKRRTYSYIHTKDKAKSRLDRIYVNDENCNEIMSYKHVPTIFVKAGLILQRGKAYFKLAQ